MDSFESTLSTMIEDAVERAIRKALQDGRQNSKPALLTIDEAAKAAGCSKREFQYRLANKELETVKIGRRTMIDPEDLRTWFAKLKRKPAASITRPEPLRILESEG